MSVPWKERRTPAYVRQEREQAKRDSARAQINSGRLWHSLRDVVENSKVGRLLLDCKTGKEGPLKSYRITEQDWEALHRDAARTPPGCHPGLRLDIGRFRLLVIEQATWDDAVGEPDEIGAP